MEKYRKFGDASTGIHPFTVVISPTPWGVVVASVTFPCRLLFAAFFVALLVVTDTLSYVLYLLCLPLLGKLLLAPLQRLWLRGLLFFVGHLLLLRSEVVVDGGGEGGGAHRRARGRTSSPQSAPLGGGEVLLANMQSVWDASVLEVALAMPYYTVAFPVASTPQQRRAAGATPTPTPTGAAVVARGGVRVFPPSPVQRWAVWSHVRSTGTLSFLSSLAGVFTSSSASSPSNSVAVDLAAVQAAATVPVVYFPEGTCSNGKGILCFDPLVLRGNRPLPRPRPRRDAAGNATRRGSDEEEEEEEQEVAVGGRRSAVPVTVAVATVTYNTPAVQNIVSERVGLFSYLFGMSKLLYGSTSPTWSSPFFPVALVQLRRSVALDATRPADANDKGGERSGHVLTTSAVESVRDAMCMKGGSRVTSAGAGGIRRQPLAVGVAEKVGFLEVYLHRQ